MKRFFLVLVLCVLLLAPFVAFAQERDPGCKTDVTKTGEPVICLAVPFGTVVKVSGISQYIQQFYNFFIGAVLSLAVFMIVIGGVQWVFALGNPGKIGKAKSTITNAFLGVLLAFISVGMLRIINPDLITLKLPEIKSVKENNYFGDQACDSLPTSPSPTKVLVNGSHVDGTKANSSSFICGLTYQIVGNTTSECKGMYCKDELTGNEGTCAPSGCVYGRNIMGTIQWDGGATLTDGFYVDNIWLQAVCDGYKLGDVETDIHQDTTLKTWYQLSTSTDKFKGVTRCSGQPVLGYLIRVEVNDASSSWWTNDDFAVLSTDCKFPIKKRNNPAELAKVYGDEITPGTDLFTTEELKYPILCDIEIRASRFAGQNGLVATAIPEMNPTEIRFPTQQWNAAESGLKQFLMNLNARQPLQITSISSDNMYTNPVMCEPWKPQQRPLTDPDNFEDYLNENECVHVFGSTHYGGLSRPVGKRPSSQAEVNAGGFSCGADIAPLSGTYAELEANARVIDPTIHAQCELAGSVNNVNCSTAGVTHLHIDLTTGCRGQ